MRLSLASLLPALPVFCLTSVYVAHQGGAGLHPGDIVEIQAGSPLHKLASVKTEAIRVDDGKRCWIREGAHTPDPASLLVLRTSAEGDYVVHLQAAQDTTRPGDCGRSVDVVLPKSGLAALQRASALNSTALYVLAAQQKGSSFELESIPTD